MLMTTLPPYVDGCESCPVCLSEKPALEVRWWREEGMVAHLDLRCEDCCARWTIKLKVVGCSVPRVPAPCP